ncbi:MAG: hypothetical protein K0S33_285 [Bacteroidetes bacterium]|nr:hypothetical protein [Bacteroidota bacterium]
MGSLTFELAKGLLFMLPELAILAACLYYFVKQKSTDSILLSLGSIVSLCVMGFYRILMPIFQYSSDYNFFGYEILYNIVSFISFAGYTCFAIGLFILVVKQVKKNTPGI